MHTWYLKALQDQNAAPAASWTLTAERDTITGEAGLFISQDAASAQHGEGKKQWQAPCTTYPSAAALQLSVTPIALQEEEGALVEVLRLINTMYSGFAFFLKCEFHGYQLTCFCFANGNAGQYL